MVNKLQSPKKAIASLIVKETTLSPILKYCGGKGWMLERVRSLYLPHTDRRLVELFCGGIAITMGLNPREALLNDINPDLINLYQCIQEGIEPRFVAPVVDKDSYYANRDRFNKECDRHAKAILFYQLNRTGYNGLCRYNQKGGYNNPAGDKFPTLNPSFNAYRRVFERWSFSSKPFEELLIGDNDFIFGDPPYDDGYSQYSKEGFHWADQVRCAEWLAIKHVPVIATNKATDRVVELYSDLGFDIAYVDAPRRIACNGDRKPVREMFATKNLKLKEAIA